MYSCVCVCVCMCVCVCVQCVHCCFDMSIQVRTTPTPTLPLLVILEKTQRTSHLVSKTVQHISSHYCTTLHTCTCTTNTCMPYYRRSRTGIMTGCKIIDFCRQKSIEIVGIHSVEAWHRSTYMYQCIYYILLRRHYICSLYLCMSPFKSKNFALNFVLVTKNVMFKLLLCCFYFCRIYYFISILF